MEIGDRHTAVYQLMARIGELRRQLQQTEQSIIRYQGDTQPAARRRSLLSQWQEIVFLTRAAAKERPQPRGLARLLQRGLTEEATKALRLIESQERAIRSALGEADRSLEMPLKHLTRNERTRDSLSRELVRLEASIVDAAAHDAENKALAEQAAIRDKAKRGEMDALKAKQRAPQDRVRALAAGVTGRARDKASRIRRRMREKQTHCPYCAGEIGNKPHADHIYPVAKGGLSTLENMVLVCAECNSKKSGHTLRSFIQLYSLDREAIESRLADMGKDF